MNRTERKDLLHIITKSGEHKTIPFPAKSSNHINESNNDDYKIDLDWYLNNGYMKLEDALKEIENNNGKTEY